MKQNADRFADFGHVLEGYQVFQEKVHPYLIPGGVVYAQNLIHQLRLAVERRTTLIDVDRLKGFFRLES